MFPDVSSIEDLMGPYFYYSSLDFSGENNMPLNVGKTNQMHSYRRGDTWLNSSTCERDFRCLVNIYLYMSQKCGTATKKAKAASRERFYQDHVKC